MNRWTHLGKRLHRPWLIALLLAIGLHVAWFVSMPRHFELVPPRTRIQAAGFVYLGSEARARSIQQLTHDARAAQSPTLFALPSPMGFSGPLLLGKAQRRPQGMTVDYFGAKNSTGAVWSTGEGLLWTSMLAQVAWQLHDGSSEPVASTAFPPRPATGRATLRLVGLDELYGMDAVMSARQEDEALRDAKPWELTASIRFDELGAVQSILFDKPAAAPERNLAARRILHNYHLPPDLGIRSGRVSLRYEPGAVEATP